MLDHCVSAADAESEAAAATAAAAFAFFDDDDGSGVVSAGGYSRSGSGDSGGAPWFREGGSGSAWLAPLASRACGGGDARWESRGGFGASLAARSLVCACLHPVPERRPKAHVLLHHPWLRAAVAAAAAAAAAKAPATATVAAAVVATAAVPAAATTEAVAVAVPSEATAGSHAPLHPLLETAAEDSDSDDGECAVAVAESDDVLTAQEPLGLAADRSSSSSSSTVAAASAAVSASASAADVSDPVAGGGAGPPVPLPKALRRMFSDIGLGSGSVSHVSHLEDAPLSPKPPGARAWRDTPGGANGDAAGGGGGGALVELEHPREWWWGVLRPGSALLCPLTGKPFDDPARVACALSHLARFPPPR
jgi:hypothetical protein